MENQAFLKKPAELAVLQAQAFSNRQTFATHIPNMFIVPYDEFEQQYGSNLYLDSDFDVLIFDGDLTLAQGTINNQWLAKQFKRAGGNNNSRAMFVSGNLLINGNIIDDDYLFLQVVFLISYSSTMNALLSLKTILLSQNAFTVFTNISCSISKTLLTTVSKSS